MSENKQINKNKNKNSFLISCISCIVLLLVICYFGINNSIKGTKAAGQCPEGYDECASDSCQCYKIVDAKPEYTYENSTCTCVTNSSIGGYCTCGMNGTVLGTGTCNSSGFCNCPSGQTTIANECTVIQGSTTSHACRSNGTCPCETGSSPATVCARKLKGYTCTEGEPYTTGKCVIETNYVSNSCAAGKYWSSSLEKCHTCSGGYYCPGGDSAQIICPIGSYCPEGSSAPTSCPTGKTTTSTGRDEVEDCVEKPKVCFSCSQNSSQTCWATDPSSCTGCVGTWQLGGGACTGSSSSSASKVCFSCSQNSSQTCWATDPSSCTGCVGTWQLGGGACTGSSSASSKPSSGGTGGNGGTPSSKPSSGGTGGNGGNGGTSSNKPSSSGTGGTGGNGGTSTSSSSNSNNYVGGSSNNSSSSSSNIENNPQTGEIAIFVVWVVALGAIVYSVWYFRKVKES